MNNELGTRTLKSAMSQGLFLVSNWLRQMLSTYSGKFSRVQDFIRRNFRSSTFRGARTHEEVRRYRYSASGNIRSFKADVSAKTVKFCTT